MESMKSTSVATASFHKVSRKGKMLSDGGAKTRCRRHDRRKTCEALHRYLGPVMSWED